MHERFNPELRGGGISWAMLGATVLLLEARGETLSNAYSRAVNHENLSVRAATLGMTALTVSHLLDLIPENYDPIDRITDQIGAIRDTMEGVSNE